MGFDPKYALIVSTAPSVEPITAADMKTFLRVDHTDEDALITGLIKAARQEAEVYMGRTLITTTWKLYLDEFPAWEIYMPRPPLQSVTSPIVYLDANGASQNLTDAHYRVDAFQEPGRLTPLYGEDWPSTRDVTNAVTITYKGGYGDAAANVPQEIILGIEHLVAHWYVHREGVQDRPMTEIPLTARSLFDLYRVVGVE